MAGYMVAGMPYRSGDDALLYYPLPRDIRFTRLRALMDNYRQDGTARDLYDYSGLMPRAKVDALCQITYYRSMVEHYRRNPPDRRRVDAVAGVVGYYYKNLTGHIPFDETAFALPAWLPLEADEQQLEEAGDVLGQHYDLIRALRGDHAGELVVLGGYRCFITLGDPDDWIAFAIAYSTHRFSKLENSPWLPQVTVQLLRRTLMNASDRKDFAPIFEVDGFNNIARAIRSCTVQLRYWKDVKKSQTAFRVRHGLGDDLRRQAHDPDRFIEALSEFVYDYARESSSVQASMNETRPFITEQDLLEVVTLVNEYGSRVVASLLVAAGYASDYSRSAQEIVSYLPKGVCSMSDLRSLSLACRVTLDMHALNNEGSESNRLMTRQVGIVTHGEDDAGATVYQRATVNAISGDMNKHIFADSFRHIALDMGLPLCPACVDLDPARMMGNPGFEDWVKTTKEGRDIVDRLISCAVDDVCGILITAGSNSVKRKSAVEFGWTVGLPEITEVEEYIHARHAVRRITRTKASEDKSKAQEEKEANLGQMVFNRPASSGVYAFVAHLDVGAIGFNDIEGSYPETVPDWSGKSTVGVDRAARLRAVLLALAQTVLQPKGALTSTQLPHVLDVDGFVSTSTSAAAAPLISPLNDDYLARAGEVSTLLNGLHGNSVAVLPFDGQDELLRRISEVVGYYAPGRYGRG